MKCQYCGGNLELETEVCPFCGRENAKANKYVATKKEYQKEFDETEQKVKKQVKISAIAGRLIFILMMAIILSVMAIINSRADNVETRIEDSEQRIAKTVDENIDSISTALQEMEQNREYQKMHYFVLNYRLSSRDEFFDYTRVFTAVSSYSVVFEDILSIASGYDYFGEKETADWCKSIANSITSWNKFVEGEFWGDTADSPMHSGEHGAFLSDIKVATQDIVQVYFSLTDEQANEMWNMEEEKLSNLLYSQYTANGPEVVENE